MTHPPTPPSIQLRFARLADTAVLARLMTEAISWGRLGEFGPGFVRLLHRHMIRSRHCVCIVAEENHTTLGYIAVVTDTRPFYREFLLKYGILAGLQLLPRLWHPRHLQTAIRGFTHFSASPKDDPPAEAISFAIQAGLKTRGIGTMLFQGVVAELKARGVTLVKFATVDVNNLAGNAFYKKLGCTLLRTVPFYRDSLVNVYVYAIDGGA